MIASEITKLAEMDIVSMLDKVFRGEIPEMPVPTDEIKATETPRGVVTRINSHRLYAMTRIMSRRCIGLLKEHNRLHEVAEQDHDCESFVLNFRRLQKRHEILNGLFWQSVTEEHPAVAANNVMIRKDWTLIGEEEEWDPTVPFSNNTGLASNLIDKVSAIVRGTLTQVTDNELGPVSDGEKVIGVIEDGRVKSLNHLNSLLYEDLKSQFPPGFDTLTKETIGNTTLNELKRFGLLSTRFQELAMLATSLFWLAVRDSLPAAQLASKIGLRQGWQIIEYPEEKTSAVELIMTPHGPGLSISVHALQELMRASKEGKAS